MRLAKGLNGWCYGRCIARHTGAWTLIDCWSKSEDERTNVRENNEPKHAKDGTFAKRFREIQGQNNKEHEVNKGDKQQNQQRPCRSSYDFEQNVGVVDRDDGSPTRITSLREDFPQADDCNNANDEEGQPYGEYNAAVDASC